MDNLTPMECYEKAAAALRRYETGVSADPHLTATALEWRLLGDSIRILEETRAVPA
jgi:hypothetical protein